MQRRIVFVVSVVVGLVIAAPAAWSAPGVVDEHWLVIEMDGARAGWGVERESVLEGGDRLMETEMRFRIDRMGQTVEIASRMESVETASGELVRIAQTQSFGTAPQTTTYHFEEDGVRVVSEQGGRSTESRVERPEGEWLTPLEAAAVIQEALESGEASFSVSVIDASMGLRVMESTYEVRERTTVEAMGKVVPAIEWSVTNSAMPSMAMTMFVNEEGEAVRNEMSVGGLKLTMLQSEKEFALSPFDAPELMATTLIRPDRAIEAPRGTVRAEYILSVEGGGLPDLPSAGAQRVERIDDGRARVVVDIERPLPAPAEEVADPRYMASTRYCDLTDPALTAVRARAIPKDRRDAPARERAALMEQFVAEFIDEKSLGVGFATSSEVCETRQGDCSEHAVLLTALLRADGIPARAVSGLVYVDQFVGEREVFGYHMWTQALIEEDGVHRWIDLDAAVNPFDATHIAVVTSSLGDDDMINSMVGVAETMGGLGIEVVSVE